MSGVTQSFAEKVAAQIGANPAYLYQVLHAWQGWENADAANNPLATTQHAPGSSPLGGNPNQNGGNPVQEYTSEDSGAKATADTLMNGNYPTLLSGLQNGNLSASAANEVRLWGTGGFANQLEGGPPAGNGNDLPSSGSAGSGKASSYTGSPMAPTLDANDPRVSVPAGMTKAAKAEYIKTHTNSAEQALIAEAQKYGDTPLSMAQTGFRYMTPAEEQAAYATKLIAAAATTDQPMTQAEADAQAQGMTPKGNIKIADPTLKSLADTVALWKVADTAVPATAASSGLDAAMAALSADSNPDIKAFDNFNARATDVNKLLEAHQTLADEEQKYGINADAANAANYKAESAGYLSAGMFGDYEPLQGQQLGSAMDQGWAAQAAPYVTNPAGFAAATLGSGYNTSGYNPPSQGYGASSASPPPAGSQGYSAGASTGTPFNQGYNVPQADGPQPGTGGWGGSPGFAGGTDMQPQPQPRPPHGIQGLSPRVPPDVVAMIGKPVRVYPPPVSPMQKPWPWKKQVTQ